MADDLRLDAIERCQDGHTGKFDASRVSVWTEVCLWCLQMEFPLQRRVQVVVLDEQWTRWWYEHCSEFNVSAESAARAIREKTPECR